MRRDHDLHDPACFEERGQSPIDIPSAAAQVRQVPPLEFLYRAASFDVIHTGYTLQATLVEDGERCGILLGSEFHPLVQFHPHTPSEHAIDGHHAKVELHFVHKSAKGELTVVAVMVELGAPNTELEKVWKIAPVHEGPGGTVRDIDIRRVLPASRANFRYSGSLTMPPLLERVRWIVMQRAITMSPGQIKKLQGLFSGHRFPSGNARALQPLGARTVDVDSAARAARAGTPRE
jgi:carbonic anhydrase